MVSEFSVENTTQKVVRKLSVQEIIRVLFWFATIGELNLLSNITAENERRSNRPEYKNQM